MVVLERNVMVSSVAENFLRVKSGVNCPITDKIAKKVNESL